MSSGSSSDQSGTGSPQESDDSSGSFLHGDDPQDLTFLQDLIGKEAYEHSQRSAELSRHPRLLTDAERAVLRETVAPLLRDLTATSMTLPDIREEAHEDRGTAAVCAWIQGSDGIGGEGIWIWLDRPIAERVAALAEQLQQWAADRLYDAGQPPGWPQCPDHPRSHELSPEVRASSAVWICSESGRVISNIGTLAKSQ